MAAQAPHALPQLAANKPRKGAPPKAEAPGPVRGPEKPKGARQDISRGPALL